MTNFNIRTMQEDEVCIAIDLAANEGWNPGLHDAPAFYETDPRGFFVGLLDGRPIGCISAVSYAGAFGFIGLYIVAPHYRGKGYGIQLWQHAVERLRGHNVGLDGVVERQPQYMQSGFKLAYRNVRYEAQAQTATADPALTDLRSISFEQLNTYDKQFFPVERSRFLAAWIATPNAVGMAYMQNGKLAGYGVIRECRAGYKIGPLFADNPEIAESLFLGLGSRVMAKAPVFLDIPEPNAEALALVTRHNMQKVFETARMYTQQEPSINLNNTYGITTFELG